MWTLPPAAPLPIRHHGNWHKNPFSWNLAMAFGKEQEKKKKSEQLYLLYALWKHIFHMVPESLCSFVLCTNMSGSLFSSPEQTAQASSSSSSSMLAGPKVPWDCFLQTQSKERTGGTGIDLALINHCTMIHDCCQAVDLIYGPPAVECGYRSSSWTCSAAGK